MAHKSISKVDEALEAFVRCEIENCADINDIHTMGTLFFANNLYPQEFKALMRCSDQYQFDEDASTKKCDPMFNALLDKARPSFDEAVKHYKFFENNNLQNYDLEKYRDQFWYTPVGSLWKRQRHNKDITPDACSSIERASEQCVNDDFLRNAECMKLRCISYLCRAGISCIDIQDSLVQCYSKFAGNNKAADNRAALPQGFIDCVNQVPQFKKHSQAK